jgi:hypothetical protein
VDSPDLTREFKRESSSITVVRSVLVILGCSLLACAPESGP